MEVWELLRHVADNCESDRQAGYGLFFLGKPASAVSPRGIQWESSEAYTLAPRTRVINGWEVPAPMDKQPNKSDIYHCEDASGVEYCHSALWTNSKADLQRFSIGIHATAEAAAANCKARYGIDPEWGE